MWSPLCALLFTPNVLVSAGLVPLGLRIGPLVGLGGIELQQDGGLEKRDDICGYVNIFTSSLKFPLPTLVV